MASEKAIPVISKLRKGPAPKAGPKPVGTDADEYEETLRSKLEYALESCEGCLEDEAKARAFLKKNKDKAPDDLKNRIENALAESAE